MTNAGDLPLNLPRNRRDVISTLTKLIDTKTDDDLLAELRQLDCNSALRVVYVDDGDKS